MRKLFKQNLAFGMLILLSLVTTGCTFRTPPSSQNNRDTQKTENPKETKGNSPQVVLLNDLWQKYTNNKYKYSLNIPTEYYINQGSCIKTNNKYEYKPAVSQTKVTENDNITTIFPITVYSLNQDESSCELLDDSSKNPDTKWQIESFKAVNGEEIDYFIRKSFGNGCKLEVLKPTNSQNVYDVVVNRNEECKIDQAYFFKYHDKLQIGVSIVLGKAFTFYKDSNFGNNAYDEEMLSSFAFIE